MTLKLDNVAIVVEDLDTAIDFFTVLGLELEGRGMVDAYRLCYIRGPEDILIGLAEPLG